MNLNSLYEKIQGAKDVREICQCVVEATDDLKKNSDGMTQEYLNKIISCFKPLIYGTLKMVEEKDVENAQFFGYKLLSLFSPVPKEFFILYYVLGRAKYIGGDYVRAEKLFVMHDNVRAEIWGDFDELSFFYRANCLAMQGYFSNAAEIYKAILNVKADFPEVQNNLNLVEKNTNENLIHDISSLWNLGAWQDVPIFINSRDRVGVLQKLIDWLLDAGYRNLIILDNNSTYENLLNYYSELEKDERVKIIRLEKNLGYKALWLSNVLEDLKISTPYVYTDPDVVPIKNCPKDFVNRLFEILNNNREMRKVGPALVWEDITFPEKNHMKNRESNFKRSGYITSEISYANIDTTFALHSNLRSYSLRFSLRTYGDIRLKHLPWYFNYKKLPPDEKYYLKHADKNSITTVKNFA